MQNSTKCLRIVKSCILFIAIIASANAATIKGKVLDGKTNEPLTGALVFNKDNVLTNDVAGLDGSITIKNVAPGKYTFVAKFIGFSDFEKEVTIKDANETITLDFMMEMSAVSLNQFTVVSDYEKGSDNYARSAEKNSDNTLNIMSAKTIELLPDLTVGNVLQRVSGVTVEKSTSGEGRYAIIRGMEKRYNYTSIDGVKIPSPDNKNRYVPMDIFPSDIVERLEVIKTLTPSMEGDAIGGVMNLVLKDAPDKFILNANASTGYSQLFFDQSFTKLNTSGYNNKSPYEAHGANYIATPADFPLTNLEYTQVKPAPNINGGLSIGNRFLNGKLGVIFSGSFQNTYSGTKSLFITPSAQPAPSPAANTPSFDDVQDRNYSVHQQREAAHVKLDYIFDKNNKISLYSIYTGLNENRVRIYSDTIAGINVGEVDQHYESKNTYQNIFNATMHGDHTLIKDLVFDWSAAYSNATATIPDWGTLSYVGSSLNVNKTWKSMGVKWVDNSDLDKSAYGNLTYKFKIQDNTIELKGGGMYRNKMRDNSYDDYSMTMPGSQAVGSISNIIFTVDNPLGKPQDPNNYHVEEDVTAGYGQAKINFGKKFQVLGGLRIEHTEFKDTLRQSNEIAGHSETHNYTDNLPSVVVKYAIDDRQNIRASYFASISRPGFFELIPYSIPGEYFTEVGNDSIHHSQADNYDVRYEFFPKPSEQILAGVFYKKIADPIEFSVVRPVGKISALELKPQNFGNATNYGFEFVISKYIKNFGVSANYTYTHSEITTDKFVYSKYHPTASTTSDTTYTVSQTRPLQGQANHIANISFMYKNQKIGLDMLISAVYTGKLIAQVSADYGLDYWQMPMTRLDFSFEKRLSKKIKLSIYGKANNILNTAYILRIMQPVPAAYQNGAFKLPQQDDVNNSILVEKEQYYQGYLLGIRYKF